MNIYWKLKGAHYHMRVFMNGGKCGDLCCREDEWAAFRASFSINEVHWIEDEDPLVLCRVCGQLSRGCFLANCGARL